MLARISRVLKDHAVRKRLLEADSSAAAHAIVVAEEHLVTHAVRVLGLSNVQALHQRVEALANAAPFDTLLARAVSSLPALAQLALPLTRTGTRLIAYKGQRPDAEIAALPAPWRVLEVRAIKVPGLAAERCLVVLEAGPGGGAVPAGSPAA